MKRFLPASLAFSAFTLLAATASWAMRDPAAVEAAENSVAPIPEPGALLLFAVGAGVAAALVRKHRAHRDQA